MILFVYNAKSSFLNKYVDTFHKIISPETYACNLCALTHNDFSEKKIWSSFRKKHQEEFVFMYKNQFEKKYPDFKPKFDFPFVVKIENNDFMILISNSELNTIKSSESLIEILKERL